jgi:hypothetical protein
LYKGIHRTFITSEAPLWPIGVPCAKNPPLAQYPSARRVPPLAAAAPPTPPLASWCRRAAAHALALLRQRADGVSMLFSDRADAGRRLGGALAARDPPVRDPLVIALPRGGVPVGDAVARILGAQLEVRPPRRRAAAPLYCPRTSALDP